MLDLIERKANQISSIKKIPPWVSDSNITLIAYKATMELMDEKLNYIKSSNNLSDFRVKKNYQISANSVANKISVATTTLISTSSYSKNFSCFLNDINNQLENEKNIKLARRQKTIGAGVKQRKKEQILLDLRSTQEELKTLKLKNAEDQVNIIFKSLSLPIRRKLGFDI
jgi:hypothetical protein